MSTGADCSFIEIQPGIWKYKIQCWPYGDWDEYDTNGPFNSFRVALAHLDSNYANPGGWSCHINKEKHIHEYNNERGEEKYCITCGILKNV